MQAGGLRRSEVLRMRQDRNADGLAVDVSRQSDPIRVFVISFEYRDSPTRLKLPLLVARWVGCGGTLLHERQPPPS